MAKLRTYSGAAILVVAHFGAAVACSGSKSDAGGSGGTGPATGGGFSDGGSPSGGASPAGGSGGDGATCVDTNPADGACVCEKSLDEFCSIANCSLPGELECGSANFTSVSFYRGCGYVRRTAQGEEQSSKIWSEATGDLLYSFAKYVPGDGSDCATLMGEAPECDAWELDCDMGFGGAGGGGGQGGATPE